MNVTSLTAMPYSSQQAIPHNTSTQRLDQVSKSNNNSQISRGFDKVTLTTNSLIAPEAEMPGSLEFRVNENFKTTNTPGGFLAIEPKFPSNQNSTAQSDLGEGAIKAAEFFNDKRTTLTTESLIAPEAEMPGSLEFRVDETFETTNIPEGFLAIEPKFPSNQNFNAHSDPGEGGVKAAEFPNNEPASLITESLIAPEAEMPGSLEFRVDENFETTNIPEGFLAIEPEFPGNQNFNAPSNSGEGVAKAPELPNDENFKTPADLIEQATQNVDQETSSLIKTAEDLLIHAQFDQGLKEPLFAFLYKN